MNNKLNSFSIDGLTTFSTYVFGMVGLLAGRFILGLDWATSLLLYFPAKGLARAIVNNEIGGIVDSLFLLILFPQAAPVFTEWFVRMASNLYGADLVQEVKMVVEVMAVLSSFGGVLFIAHFVAMIFSTWRLPNIVHEVGVRLIVIIACSLALLVTVFGIRLLETRGVSIGIGLRLVILLLVCGAYALCIWGALRAPIYNPWKAPPIPTPKARPIPSGKAPKNPPPKPVVHKVTPPSVRLADVAGMQEVKRQIRLRLIEPVRDSALAKKYGINVGGGMLLYGPPGTGKTFIAKAVAGELGLPFFAITAADVFGMYVGESERNILKIFEEVRKHPLSVVFIDELETLFPKRTDDIHETTRKVISLLLQELDGIDKAKNPILLLGATNVPWMIDEAFMRPGRFDVRVFVGLPDFDARRQMFKKAFATGSVPYTPGLIDYLAERTDGYSGADINGVMANLRQTAYERRLPAYKTDLVDEVLARTAPSGKGDILAAIREWESKVLGE